MTLRNLLSVELESESDEVLVYDLVILGKLNGVFLSNFSLGLRFFLNAFRMHFVLQA